MDNSMLGTTAVLGLSSAWLAYDTGPWNWAFVPNRWAGVIVRFGHVDESVGVINEGPVHLRRPIDRLIRIPLFDLAIPVKLPNLVTAGPVALNMDLHLLIVIKFKDPIKVILSVPEREPVEELKKFIVAAARSAVQSKTMDQHAEAGGGDRLAETIRQKILAEPIFQRWGVEVISSDVVDTDFAEAYYRAQETILAAEAEAKAIGISADAKRKAADILGNANRQGLWAQLLSSKQESLIAMAKAGALKTWVNMEDGLDHFLDGLLQDIFPPAKGK